MLTIQCPNCSSKVEIDPEFLGKQVGCTRCKRVYVLSREYNDFFYKRLVVFNTVVLCLLVAGIFFKIELDYRFIGKSVKAARKSVSKKVEDFLRKEEPSSELEFYDFDRAYGTAADKLKRTKPVVLDEHRGRVVQWGGEVLDVYAVVDNPYGDYCVRFRQTQGASSDVTVYFLEDQAQSVANIQKGHYLRYQGVIVSAGYGNTDHILRRGKILD